MPSIKSLACPNCNAPLPAGARGRVTCEYCGREVEVDKAQPPRSPVATQHQLPGGINVPLQVVVAQATAARSRIGCLIGGFIIPLVVGGIVLAVVLAQHKATSSRRTGSGPGGGGYTPSGENLSWDTNARSPLVVTSIDGDAIEDFVGSFRLRSKGSQQIYVGGFAGQGLTRIWKAGPYGDGSAGPDIRYGVAGNRVVVTDPGAILHILDLENGTELRSIRLSDRAESMCPFPEGHSMWVEVKDEQHVTVDLDTGALSRAPRPDFCHVYEWATDCWRFDQFRYNHGHARCFPAKKLPSIPGFAGSHVIGDGDAYVVLGHKSPGTRIPMIAGFPRAGTETKGRPALGELVWTRNVGDGLDDGAPDLADLAGGVLVIAHENQKDGWRLLGFDAATGDSRWDVPIPRSETGSGASAFVMTETRIYLPHWTWLDIFETATGQHVGTVGVW